MISNEQTRTITHSRATASLHPETGNLRLALAQDGKQFSHFFANKDEALEFLEGALELVDPTAEGADV
jgi:hypothetical protein